MKNSESRYRITRRFPIRAANKADVLVKVMDDKTQKLIKLVVPNERAGDNSWIVGEIEKAVWHKKVDSTANPRYSDSTLPLNIHKEVSAKWGV